jgi:transposase
VILAPLRSIGRKARRWTMRGLWRRLFDALTRMEPGDVQAIDSTTAKAHRSAAGGKGGRGAGDRSLAWRSHNENPPDRRSRGRPIALEVTPGQIGDVRVALALISAVPPGRRLAGDAAYDSDGLRRLLIERGTLPVIPNNPTRKRPHPFDEHAYRHRNLIERMFCRLKDWRRISRKPLSSASTCFP